MTNRYVFQKEIMESGIDNDVVRKRPTIHRPEPKITLTKQERNAINKAKWELRYIELITSIA